MKLACQILALTAAISLGACTRGDSGTVDGLNNAQAVGSAYTKMLTKEYRDFANKLDNDTNHADALHFNRKGLAAANDVVVMPEVLDDWDLSDKNIAEMTPARAELVDALENGGRDAVPALASVAQVRFDCWAEEQEKDWNAEVPCKNQFKDALAKLKAALPLPAPPVAEAFPTPVMEEPKGAEAPIQQAMFVVFFDWDKSTLSGGANDVIDALSQELKNRQDVKQVVIAGYTDTSGAPDYNQKLSMKRANAVHDALVARGIPLDQLRVEAHGEEDLLVPTDDNVREPANRRARITLE